MKKIFVFFIFAILYLLFAIDVMAAASLSLSPTSHSVSVGQTFDVNLVLNTGGASSNGCDIILTFNPQIIKVNTVSFGTNPLFVSTNVSTPDNTNGKLTLNSSVMSSAYAYNGTGTLATITFKGEGTGSSAVSFTCTAGATNDTNVWNTQAQDIVDCSANIGGNYTVTTGSSVTPTATPTPEDGESLEPTATPTPPEAGSTSLTIASFVFGIFLLFIGLLKFLPIKS